MNRQQRRLANHVSALPNPLPPPNLNGDYEGSCILCLRGCDTGFGLRGESEWIAAAYMVKLLIPKEEAIATVEHLLRDRPFDRLVDVTTQLCMSCAEERGIKVDLLLPRHPLPAWRQYPS